MEIEKMIATKGDVPMSLRILLQYANPFRTIKALRQQKLFLEKEQTSHDLISDVFLVFTCDIEFTPLLLRGLKQGEAEQELEDGTKLILKLLEENQVIATFFVEGIISEKLPSIISRLKDRGHEIGCHGYVHSSFAGKWFLGNHGLPESLSIPNRRNHIKKASKAIEDITGKQPVSFRAPFFASDEKTLKILESEGFLVDSSLYNLVYGKFSLPYHPHPYDMAREGEMNLYELPITVSPIPRRKWLILESYAPLLNCSIAEIQSMVSLIQKISYFYGHTVVVIVPIIHLWEYLLYEAGQIRVIQKNLMKLRQFFDYTDRLGVKSVSTNKMIEIWENIK